MGTTKDHQAAADHSWDRIKRKLAIIWLQIRNGERRPSSVTILLCLVTFFVLVGVFHGANSHMVLNNNRSIQGEHISLPKCGPKIKGLGAPTHADDAISKKIGFISVGGKDSKRSLLNQLKTIEFEMNGGWNRSDALIVPLGQAGYVKRDLPVYKAALQQLGLSIAKRPPDGFFTADLLQNENYAAVICLSFNTDHCFETNNFPMIARNKRVNRLQALRDVVWSKHKFCRTINSAIRGLENEEYTSFTFPCWVMPSDYDHLVNYSNQQGIKKFISKPRSLGAGMGIYIIDNYSDLTKERRTQNVIQPFMDNPHLIKKIGIDGVEGLYKWDLRTYVLCTSITPLRAYVYSRGLVRFATTPYSRNVNCTADLKACLTNTSINKKSEGAKLKDITWSLNKLEKYIKEHESADSFEDIFLRVQKAIGLTLLSTESSFLRAFQGLHKDYKCENCYHLLGVDVLFNDELEPKIVEINGEPSLRLTSIGKTHYDFTKKYMAKDMLGIVFNKDGAANNDLTNRMQKWSQCVSKRRNNGVKIGRDHAEYVLNTFREHKNMGKFYPVYPNKKLASTYHGFLETLHLKEKEQLAKSSTKIGAHADGRRLRLHELITNLQNEDSVIFSNSGVSKTQSSSLKESSHMDDDDDDDSNVFA